MKQLVLAAILFLMPGPSPAWDETKDEYRARMGLIAQAISDVTQDKQLAMGIVTIFWWESRFSPKLHSGERKGDVGHAICMGQHHRNSRSEEAWEALAGTDLEATKRCARATGKVLVSAEAYCRKRRKNRWEGAFTLYGTGRTCDPAKTKYGPNFRGRGRMHRRLMKRFVR